MKRALKDVDRRALAGTSPRRGSPATPAPFEFASACCTTDSHRSSLAADHRLVAVDPKLNSCATVMAHPGIAASKIGEARYAAARSKGCRIVSPSQMLDIKRHA